MNDVISRGAVLEAISESRKHLSASHCRLRVDDVIRIIYTTPDLDAQPVVHASQIETGFDEAYCNWGDCTNCGCSNIYRSKYCNECGARMDGDPHDSGQ